MKTVWIDRKANWSLRTSLRSFSRCLLVDVIPAILMLAAMAYGMAFISHQLSEPRSVEIKVVADKLG